MRFQRAKLFKGKVKHGYAHLLANPLTLVRDAKPRTRFHRAKCRKVIGHQTLNSNDLAAH